MTPKGDQSGLRNLIIDEATRLFATKGFSGTSIRELAEACSCTKPALYYYYPSKEAIFIEVVEQHAKAIDEMFESTILGPGSVRDRLHKSLDAMIDHCIANPMAVQLMQRLETSPEASAPVMSCADSRETHIQLLTKLIHEGRKSEELRGDIDPDDGAQLLAGAMNFQFEQSITTGEWNRPRMHRIVDLVLDGIAQ